MVWLPFPVVGGHGEHCFAHMIAKLVQMTPRTMVYYMYDYIVFSWGDTKPTNITGIPH